MTKTKMKVKDVRSKFSVLTVVMLVLLTVYCLILITILGWSFITAFKGSFDFGENEVGFPKPWTFETIKAAWTDASMKTFLTNTQVSRGAIIWNTIVYAVGCSLVNTVVMCVVAYLCARYPCKFSKIVYATVLVVMVVPIIGNQAAELQMSIRLGLYDRMWGMLIMRASFLGIYFLVFYDIFKATPKTYAEAAEIDGAGDFAIMLRVYFPIAANTFLTILLISFITYWNDYQTPMVYVPEHPTLAAFVFDLRRQSDEPFGTTPGRMAVSWMALLPVMILFIAFNKKLLGNLSIGGIKG